MLINALIVLLIMPLRKVLLFASGLPTNNMASFTNVTADRLHIRKEKLSMMIAETIVALDRATVELSERSTAVLATNDSRDLIDWVHQIVGDGTGAGLAPNNHASSVLTFNRGDLVLDTDDSLFMNGINKIGNPSIEANCNLFYED